MQTEKVCTVPPPGWTCSREPGHDGPCAARPADPMLSNFRRHLVERGDEGGLAYLDAVEMRFARAAGLVPPDDLSTETR
jgi:hypothetical protein